MIKLVIVEDQAIILEGIKVLINLVPDFKVIAEFKNGAHFLDNLNKIDADIILTDIDMPEINGIEMTKKALLLQPQLKIIALSMYTDQEYYYEMITAGAKGFVLKQSSVDELETAIREVNKGGNFFSKDLLHSVLLSIPSIEQKIVHDKTNQLKLTARELELLKHICAGLSNKEMAEKLTLSVKTIENNKAKLMKKTTTKNNAGLIIWSIKNKVIELE